MRASMCAMLLFGLIFPLIGCQEKPSSKPIWIPAEEQTGFEYLHDAGMRIHTALREAKAKFGAGEKRDGFAQLARAEESVLVLLYYDIPISEARQLIYDASRLFALERPRESIEHLNRAEENLVEIASHGSPPVAKAMQDVQQILDDLRNQLEEFYSSIWTKYDAEIPPVINNKFAQLNNKINLLALKSDMVMSGTNMLEEGQTH